MSTRRHSLSLTFRFGTNILQKGRQETQQRKHCCLSLNRVMLSALTTLLDVSNESAVFYHAFYLQYVDVLQRMHLPRLVILNIPYPVPFSSTNYFQYLSSFTSSSFYTYTLLSFHSHLKFLQSILTVFLVFSMFLKHIKQTP